MKNLKILKNCLMKAKRKNKILELLRKFKVKKDLLKYLELTIEELFKSLNKYF